MQAHTSMFIESLEPRRLLSAAGVRSSLPPPVELPPLRRALTGARADPTVSAGEPDPAFGIEGSILSVPVSQLFLPADGSGVVTQYSGKVLRYDATGTLDPNFGDASVQGTDAQLIVSAATTLPNGGFLEAGLTDVSEQSHLFLRSISPDGTLGGALVAPALWNGGSIA